MAFHAPRYASLTHSYASRRSPTICRDSARQAGPYLASVSWMACSDRAKYSSMMASSSTPLTPFLSSHPYTRNLLGDNFFHSASGTGPVMVRLSGVTAHPTASTSTPAAYASRRACPNRGWVASLGEKTLIPAIWMTKHTAAS